MAAAGLEESRAATAAEQRVEVAEARAELAVLQQDAAMEATAGREAEARAAAEVRAAALDEQLRAAQREVHVLRGEGELMRAQHEAELCSVRAELEHTVLHPSSRRPPAPQATPAPAPATHSVASVASVGCRVPCGVAFSMTMCMSCAVTC